MNQSQQVLSHYASAYQQLYKRTPSDLRLVENNWVIVNGTRMRLNELEYLALQLQKENAQQSVQQHDVLHRVIGWLTKH